MAETLPYMNSTGLVSKILEAIKVAKTPERFSQDFFGTVLGFTSGSARPFIPLAKRLNLVSSDGSPTELYRRFRGSEEESKAAMAEAIRIGYAPLYKRNEYAHGLEKRKLEGLVREITGMEEGSSAVRGIVGTFEALKKYADFEAELADGGGGDDGGDDGDSGGIVEGGIYGGGNGGGGNGGGGNGGGGGDASPIRFGYTININLPDTNDITVFNAIFKSMKEHLL